MTKQSNDRVKPKEIEHEIDEKGYFIRQKNHFTTPFGYGENKLPVESGRYRLIWAKGCNWSNRASIVRELLGLEDDCHTGDGCRGCWRSERDRHQRPRVLLHELPERRPAAAGGA